MPLLSLLPAVRGKLIENAPLKDQTWFRVGGAAEVLFKPEDEDDLAVFLHGCPAEVPLTILGAASNTLVRDGGIAGVVIKLSPTFAKIKAEGTTITAGAAALDLNIARAAKEAGIAGLEFLCGIPGTLGGALRMNAGAHGGQIKDCLVAATALDRGGAKHTLRAEELDLSYRHCGAPQDWIFTSATLMGAPDEPDAIAERMKTIALARADSQPIRDKTGGSTFANPEGHKAWELIDAAGCRGLRRGGAQVSEQHCNFLINTGEATAADLEDLGEEVRARVLEKTGIELRWEIKRIGVRASI